MTNPLLARILRRGGGQFLDRAIQKAIPAAEKAAASKPVLGSLVGSLAGTALVRIATRSVPGAIVVGGGLLAKMLYDRRRKAHPATDATPQEPQDEDEDHGVY